jgi:uncharacterized membrane protein
VDARVKRQVERAFAWWDLRGARIRLLTSAVVGVTLLLALSSDYTWELRALAAWDGASLFQIAVTWWIIIRADADETRRRAAAEDPGRAALSIIVLASSLVALGSATVVARKAHATHNDESVALIVASLVAVLCAWFLTHSVYTLRYARLFYQVDEDGAGGLVFPGKKPPDDLDFAYFAFTIGVAFATSDVKIEGRNMRRTALGHTLTAFAFNTLILANVLNVLADLFSE